MNKLLIDVVNFSNEKVVLFNFESRSKLAAYSMGIYCTLIELSESFSKLIECQCYSGTLSVYRTFLENYVDLQNLVNNEHYVYQLDYDNFRQEKRKLKAANNDNPYLKSIRKYANDRLPKLDVEIAALKENCDFKVLNTIKDKFELAGMDKEYNGLYIILSAESHCSLEAIFDRHFERCSESDAVQISINNKDNLSFYDFFVITITRDLILSGKLISDLLDGQQKIDFLEKKEEIALALNKHLKNASI